MKITPRQWIDTNLFIKLPLHATSSSLVIDTYFNDFLQKYCINLQSIDPTFPLLLVENVTTEKNYKTYYTYPFNNHPFIIYQTPESNQQPYILVIPFGNRFGQVNINTLYPLLPYFTIIEKDALLQLLIKSIVVRQFNLVLHPKYSVMNCYIVNECIAKINNIYMLDTSSDKKAALIDETERFFFNKIRLLLDHFFVILQESRFDDAMKFLRGEYNRFFVNKGLSEIFINSKELVGHLEIFIHLYKFLHTLRTFK